ncbi:MAG TPA: DUF6542 domain-containing protein [Mycobacteriales bacterium]|nr:DUF6542 domain-containing protein [Mycobacteriales bacterium]
MDVSVGTGSSTARVTGQGHPGLTGAGALLLMFMVAAATGAVDTFTGPGGLRRTFSVGLVVAAALGGMTVRRRGLWAVVIAPPLLYVLVSFLSTFAAPAGVFDSTAKMGAALVGWLVYGFPEIAASTGVAAVLAGIRLARRPPG